MFEREVATDPMLREWVEANGVPDYFDEHYHSGHLFLLYLYRDMVATRSDETAASSITCTYGIPDDLLRRDRHVNGVPLDSPSRNSAASRPTIASSRAATRCKRMSSTLSPRSCG